MCFVVRELCPSCECPSSKPTYFQSLECRGGCDDKVERRLTALRSHWASFYCNTEDCIFNRECSETLDDDYKSLGNIVPFFGQQPLPVLAAPLAVHPEYLASISASTAQDTPSTAQGSSTTAEDTASTTQGTSTTTEETPETSASDPRDSLTSRRPRWTAENMARPDTRPARRERKRISFGQPSQGNRVKTQFRSMGFVRMSDLEPEVAAAITAKKEAMERAIRNQVVKRGVVRYLLEEDELLQMLRLNCFGFRQISTDFMPRRSSMALSHRRGTHAIRHAKGFEYVPDDAGLDDTVEETGESSRSASNEMATDSAGDEMTDDEASNSGETEDKHHTDDKMAVDSAGDEMTNGAACNTGETDNKPSTDDKMEIDQASLPRKTDVEAPSGEAMVVDQPESPASASHPDEAGKGEVLPVQPTAKTITRIRVVNFKSRCI